MRNPQKDHLPAGQGGYESGLLAFSQANVRLAGEFLALEARMVKLVLAEMIRRQGELGRLLNSLGGLLVGPGDSRTTLELQDIGRRWVELAWLAQSAFVDAFRSAPEISRMARASSRPGSERRVSATIIRFPDRRAAQA